MNDKGAKYLHEKIELFTLKKGIYYDGYKTRRIKG